MIDKEAAELRRRLRPDRSNITKIHGCYINQFGEIVTSFDDSVALLPVEEQEKYHELLKKAISGTMGKTLSDLVFATAQVQSGEEHGLLMKLRDSKLADAESRDALYGKIAATVRFGENVGVLVLLACDTYDVPYRSKDGETRDEGGDTQFTYFICSICPVKNSKAALQYLPGQQEFRGISTGTLLAAPVLGFMFPALDEGSADIYEAQYYTKSTAENHGELISALFAVENPPMAAEVQKETFNFTLAESLGGECSLDVVTSLQAKLSARAEAVKEESPSAIAEVYIEDIEDMLAGKGVSDSKIKDFSESVGKRFDGASSFNIGNLIQKRSFEVKTPETKIVTDPENALRIKTRKIDGVTYILVPAGESVTVNGVEISTKTEE